MGTDVHLYCVAHLGLYYPCTCSTSLNWRKMPAPNKKKNISVKRIVGAILASIPFWVALVVGIIRIGPTMTIIVFATVSAICALVMFGVNLLMDE